MRGTTSKEIVQMAKDVGAKKVIVASCAPPIRLAYKSFLLLCVTNGLLATQMSMVSTCLLGRN